MRTSKAIRNTVYSLGNKVIEVILAFVSRTVFIWTLGVSYLGINGLFNNILIMLSLMELGVGSALVFSMYKPLVERDNEKLSSLLSMYANMYRIIGISIAVMGVCLTPFLPHLIKLDSDIPHLNIIYWLTLGNTVSSYFFGYKRSLLEADQKSYLNTKNNFIFTLIKHIFQIIILLLTKNFLLYLGIGIGTNILSNISISLKVNKMYPLINIRKALPLDKDTKIDIYKRMGAGMMHKIGNIVITGTDNILISVFISTTLVGIYSNYLMLTNTIYTTFGVAFSAIGASIGNLSVTENNEKSEKVFYSLFLINYWIYCFCSVCLWSLVNPLITMWLGKDYLLSSVTVAILILNFYISGMRHTVVSFVNASGLYYNSRFKPIVEAAINLIVSFVALKHWGITGVFFGTLVSYILCSVWVEPFILYKHWFKQSVKKHLVIYYLYFALMVTIAILTKGINSLINTPNIVLNFVISGVLCLLIPNVILFLIFRRTNEFNYLMNFKKKKTIKQQK